jgi:hypothetical protein
MLFSLPRKLIVPHCFFKYCSSNEKNPVDDPTVFVIKGR